MQNLLQLLNYAVMFLEAEHEVLSQSLHKSKMKKSF